MGRRINPPEGPEPDYYCRNCQSGVLGSKCSRCDMTEDEAEKAYFSRMDQKSENFLDMLDEQEKFNMGRPQIREVEYSGESLHIYPKFGISMKALLELPGVKDVTYPREKKDGLIVNYDPDRKLTRRDISYIIENFQVLANTMGVSRSGEYVRYYLKGKNEYSEKVTDDQWSRIRRVGEMLKIKQ